MRLGFHFHRISDCKWFAPIIQEALSRGHPVEIWLNYTDVSKTTKWYEMPLKEKLPIFHENGQPEILIYHNEDEFKALGSKSKANHVFSVEPPKFQKPKHQKWYHIVTSLYDSVSLNGSKGLDRFDAVFFNTSHWINVAIQYLRMTHEIEAESDLEKSLLCRFVPTGTEQLEAARFCDRKKARAKLRIPADAKVVLVFAFEMSATFWSARIFKESRLWKRLFDVLILPFSYPYIFSKLGKKRIFWLTWKSLWDRPSLFFHALTCKSEKDVMQAVRRFCDRNGALLIVKARQKHDLPDHFTRNADLLVDKDTEYFPFSAAQVISASDLAICSYSTATAESIAGGIPCLSVLAPARHLFVRDHHILLHAKSAVERGMAKEKLIFNDDEGGVFRSENAVYGWTVNEVVQRLPDTKWEALKLDPVKRQEYSRKYIKETCKPASEEILDYLEKRDAQSSA